MRRKSREATCAPSGSRLDASASVPRILLPTSKPESEPEHEPEPERRRPHVSIPVRPSSQTRDLTDSSIYPRKGSPHWYVSYWCARTGSRIHRATPWRVDDPAGKKQVLRFAAQKAQEGQALRGAAKHEVWSAWAGSYLDDRYRRQAKTLQRYKSALDSLRVFIEERRLHHPAA